MESIGNDAVENHDVDAVLHFAAFADRAICPLDGLQRLVIATDFIHTYQDFANVSNIKPVISHMSNCLPVNKCQ